MAVPALCVVELPGRARARSLGAADSGTGRDRKRRVVRRAVAVCGVAGVVGVAALLSLPLAITGGSPAPGTFPAGSGLHGAAPSTVYVVQNGDTLWSIAARYDSGGDVRPFVEALARQVGSPFVVPGERIAIP